MKFYSYSHGEKCSKHGLSIHRSDLREKKGVERFSSMPMYSVSVKEGSGLLARDATYVDSSDPRVELKSLTSGRTVSSRSAGLTLNPLWSLDSTFHSSEFPLLLSVWHTDGTNDDLPLGEAELSLLDLGVGPTAEILAERVVKLSAGSAADELVRLNESSLGSVLIAYQAHPPSQEELDEIRRREEAELALPPVVVAPPTEISAEDDVDEETRQSYNNILETQRFIEMSSEDSRVLAVTQREMADLIDRVEELGRNENFDVKYWTQATSQCWRERELADRAGEGSECAVRLFPSESAILAQKQLRARLDEDRSLIDRSEMAKRHPLLFNRVVRDESRRELFSSAMEASRAFTKSNSSILSNNASSMSVSLGGGVGGCSRNTIPKIGLGDHPFSSQPRYNATNVGAAATGIIQKQKNEQASKLQNASRSEVDVPLSLPPAKVVESAYDEQVTAATTAVAGTIAKHELQRQPQTLADMIKQQQRELGELAKREETVYRPLSNKYFEYNQVVYAKLDALADLDSSVAATS